MWSYCWKKEIILKNHPSKVNGDSICIIFHFCVFHVKKSEANDKNDKINDKCLQ